MSEQHFVPSDKVYYKRDGATRWLGPGIVLGQDGKVVFVRHGGAYVRVSANQILNANDVHFGSDGSQKLTGSGESTGTVPALPSVMDEVIDKSNGIDAIPQEDNLADRKYKDYVYGRC